MTTIAARMRDRQPPPLDPFEWFLVFALLAAIAGLPLLVTP